MSLQNEGQKTVFHSFDRTYGVIDNKLGLHVTVKPVVHEYLFHWLETRQELVTMNLSRKLPRESAVGRVPGFPCEIDHSS